MRKSRILILLLIMLIYAVCYVVIKAGLAFAPPLRFGGLRALIAGIALLGVTLVLRQPVLPTPRQWLGLVALALTATSITYAGMFLSPGRVGAGIASVLGNVQPLITIILASIFVGERLTRGKLAALLIGLMGITLIVSPSLNATDSSGALGLMLALASSVGAAMGSVIFKAMKSQRQLFTITAWQLLIGSLPLLAGSLVIERDVNIVWNGEFLGLLLFLALIGTSFTSIAWYWLVQREDVGRLSISLFLVPLLGLAIAVLAFGEEISLVKAAGVAVALAGVSIAMIEASHIPLAQSRLYAKERVEHH